jgi:hypothetical protein
MISISEQRFHPYYRGGECLEDRNQQSGVSMLGSNFSIGWIRAGAARATRLRRFETFPPSPRNAKVRPIADPTPRVSDVGLHPLTASPVPFSVCDKLITAGTKMNVFRHRCLTIIDRSEMIRTAPSAPHELGEAHAEPWSGGGTS